MKISYDACINEKTFAEYILNSILKTYQERSSKNLIKNP